MVGPALAHAEVRDDHGDRDHRRPVYQRRAFDWKGKHDDRRDRRHTQWVAPQVNAGWFQRPYPYHLDYYKMRYGGSYAPYFGNLYGPPQVVTAPPYYGPYYGDWGLGAGDYSSGGYGGPPRGYPAVPNGIVQEGTIQSSNSANKSTAHHDENLPTPTP